MCDARAIATVRSQSNGEGRGKRHTQPHGAALSPRARPRKEFARDRSASSCSRTVVTLVKTLTKTLTKKAEPGGLG